MNTLAVLIGFVGNNVLALYFYQTVGNNGLGLFFLLLNLLLLAFLMGAIRDDLRRATSHKGDDG